jgi:hypothetical protein
VLTALLEGRPVRGEIPPAVRLWQGCRRWRCLPDEWLRQDAEVTVWLEVVEDIAAQHAKKQATLQKLQQETQRRAGVSRPKRGRT